MRALPPALASIHQLVRLLHDLRERLQELSGVRTVHDAMVGRQSYLHLPLHADSIIVI